MLAPVQSAARSWAVRIDLIERVASHPKFAADRIGGVVDEMSSERFRERLLSAEQPSIDRGWAVEPPELAATHQAGRADRRSLAFGDGSGCRTDRRCREALHVGRSA